MYAPPPAYAGYVPPVQIPHAPGRFVGADLPVFEQDPNVFSPPWLFIGFGDSAAYASPLSRRPTP
eukprot:1035093-Heterocapsa_arctica.AAC.1